MFHIWPNQWDRSIVDCTLGCVVFHMRPEIKPNHWMRALWTVCTNCSINLIRIRFWWLELYLYIIIQLQSVVMVCVLNFSRLCDNVPPLLQKSVFDHNSWTKALVMTILVSRSIFLRSGNLMVPFVLTYDIDLSGSWPLQNHILWAISQLLAGKT